MSDSSSISIDSRKQSDLRQDVAIELLRREKATTNLLDFTRYTFPAYKADPAHELIAKKLDAVINGEIRRLMISAPPRHGKTELVSVRLPAYWLGRRPNDEIMLCSYGASLAEEKSGFSRDVVEAQEYKILFQGFSTRKDSRSVSKWRVNGGRGSLVATGIGGSITGKGATLAIVDDPFKDWEEAQSERIRETCWNWYRSTFLTRLEELGAIVVIQTRWHEDDLAGRLIKEQPGEWEVLRLPAMAETQEERDSNNEFLGLPLGESDPLGRLPGEPLCPNRLSLEALEQLRRYVGPSVWSALYQGVPRPSEGNRFKKSWFPMVEKIPYEAKRVRAWDKAATLDEGDYSVGSMMAMHEGIYYVENIVRGRWLAGTRDKEMRKTAEQDAARYKNSVSIWVEQEPGSGGKESAANSIRLLAGFPVRIDKVSGSKEVRAEPFASQAEGGNVRLLKAPWNNDFLNEFLSFPNGTHDDIVDSTCMAFNKLAQSMGPPPTLRVYGLRKGGIVLANDKGKKQFKIAVCGREEIENISLDQECLLVSIQDPDIVSTIPPHRCQKLLDSLQLVFADLDPNANECSNWEKEIEPWNKKPEELIMSKEQGKKLWSFLLKKRDVHPIVFLIQDSGEGDRRALSLAMGISDTMGFPREKTVYVVENPEEKWIGKAPNQHIYQICKATRHSVI